jgi:hypothetical protein
MYGDHVLLSNFGCFGDSSGNIGAFGDPDTDAILLVANDDECAEAEATTAFNYAGNTVDV